MLCKKSSKPFDINLFKNPSNEYRGTPFWSWNGLLQNDRLKKQINCFEEMGFGGFFMHSRRGLETEYLSDEYFKSIKTCIDSAKEKQMNACLYDEDRWPSGFAGGLVTKTPKYRQRVMCITANENDLPCFEFDKTKAIEEGKPYLIACFDVEFDNDGYLKSYTTISPNSTAKHNKYFAYSRTEHPSARYNFQTNVDLMQKEAIGRFIEITHNEYHKRFGDEYGKSVPTIFSDEPRQGPAEQLEENLKSTGIYHWTYNFEESFKQEYGYDIIERIPKLVWDEQGVHSYERYDYFNHTTSLFEEAFFKQIHKVTNNQGLTFCGHLMLEDELLGQIRWGGDIMRLYPHFDIPGIDMLFDFVEFLTAKQVQSIVRQYNKESMLSELYGVTGWDYDFKCLKMQGDWQAAMGVSVRVPHLSMYSMKGAAKRDYPQSFNYQAPWYKEFKYLEDHYARLNTVLNRGKDVVDVAVIHPFETTMLCYSTKEKSEEKIKNQEYALKDLAKNLLYSNLDFDFLNEALLPTQKTECAKKLTVGEMQYSTIIVPPVETLRQTTVQLLEKFINCGGNVIFTGNCPKYIDGKISQKAELLYNKSKVITDDAKLIEALEDLRRVKIISEGAENKKIYRLIQDDENYWLYAAHTERMGKTDVARRKLAPQKTVIEIKGEFGVCVYNTLTGDIDKADYEIKNGKTIIYYDWYANDCLLLKLTKDSTERKQPKNPIVPYQTLVIDKASYKRYEDNCIVLDMCKTSTDGKNYNQKKYVLEQNSILCNLLGFQVEEAQPYYMKDTPGYTVYAQFDFICESELDCLKLALERADEAKILFNGKEISNNINGYYVDEDIKTITLPKSEKGKNVLEIIMPISAVYGLEPCYILGDFCSRIENNEIILTAQKNNEVTFTPIGEQGLTFYGGNISYNFKISTDECIAKIKADNFGAPCIKVFVDGKDTGLIALSPFVVELPLSKGEHDIELLCYGNRNNTFGPIHNSHIADSNYYIVPLSWDHQNEYFTEDFHFQETGILSNPIIELYKK